MRSIKGISYAAYTRYYIIAYYLNLHYVYAIKSLLLELINEADVVKVRGKKM